MVLIVSCSLSGGSRSRKLARFAEAKLKEQGIAHEFLDLAQEANALPFAGSGAGWGHPNVGRLKKLTTGATEVLFAVPIYNYDVNSMAKTFIELMGEDALGGKTVGFLASAGGKGSYMALMPFANSLMLDFRCWIVPRFVYVSEDWTGDLPKEITERIEGLLRDLVSRGSDRQG